MSEKLALINGLGTNIGQGAVVALVSIALVFLILGIIILVTYFIGSLIRKYSKKVERDEKPITSSDIPEEVFAGIDSDDEDMVAAVIVASIDYRQESGENVRVVNVKEIK